MQNNGFYCEIGVFIAFLLHRKLYFIVLFTFINIIGLVKMFAEYYFSEQCGRSFLFKSAILSFVRAENGRRA